MTGDVGAVGDGVLLRCSLRDLGREALSKMPSATFAQALITALQVMKFAAMSPPSSQPRGPTQAAIFHPSRKPDRGAVGDGVLLHGLFRHVGHETLSRLPSATFAPSLITAL